MVCKNCEKKLSTNITPDTWKDGSNNGAVGSRGRKLNANPLLSKKKHSLTPYEKKCEDCKQRLSQSGAKYCQTCAYKKGICWLFSSSPTTGRGLKPLECFNWSRILRTVESQPMRPMESPSNQLPGEAIDDDPFTDLDSKDGDDDGFFTTPFVGPSLSDNKDHILGQSPMQPDAFSQKSQNESTTPRQSAPKMADLANTQITLSQLDKTPKMPDNELPAKRSVSAPNQSASSYGAASRKGKGLTVSSPAVPPSIQNSSMKATTSPSNQSAVVVPSRRDVLQQRPPEGDNDAIVISDTESYNINLGAIKRSPSPLQLRHGKNDDAVNCSSSGDSSLKKKTSHSSRKNCAGASKSAATSKSNGKRKRNQKEDGCSTSEKRNAGTKSACSKSTKTNGKLADTTPQKSTPKLDDDDSDFQASEPSAPSSTRKRPLRQVVVGEDDQGSYEVAFTDPDDRYHDKTFKFKGNLPKDETRATRAQLKDVADFKDRMQKVSKSNVSSKNDLPTKTPSRAAQRDDVATKDPKRRKTDEHKPYVHRDDNDMLEEVVKRSIATAPKPPELTHRTFEQEYVEDEEIDELEHEEDPEGNFAYCGTDHYDEDIEVDELMDDDVGGNINEDGCGDDNTYRGLTGQPTQQAVTSPPSPPSPRQQNPLLAVDSRTAESPTLSIRNNNASTCSTLTSIQSRQLTRNQIINGQQPWAGTQRPLSTNITRSNHSTHNSSSSHTKSHNHSDKPSQNTSASSESTLAPVVPSPVTPSQSYAPPPAPAQTSLSIDDLINLRVDNGVLLRQIEVLERNLENERRQHAMYVKQHETDLDRQERRHREELERTHQLLQHSVERAELARDEAERRCRESEVRHQEEIKALREERVRMHETHADVMKEFWVKKVVKAEGKEIPPRSNVNENNFSNTSSQPDASCGTRLTSTVRLSPGAARPCDGGYIASTAYPTRPNTSSITTPSLTKGSSAPLKVQTDYPVLYRRQSHIADGAPPSNLSTLTPERRYDSAASDTPFSPWSTPGGPIVGRSSNNVRDDAMLSQSRLF
ncbi:hypothetical protein SeLEV6574_g03993 [Synchytrium endobioticum]|uniref:Cysteine-rich PDZ-binding protein n=1 Tax=Synchytrium endobioticum TaxID=286115 RepID=A0A507D1N6_9FUNG|nr:hypothetical protein SeLEV6574_g03993 [Synchytrium endobioticum]